MGLGSFISKMVVSITRTTFQFNKTLDVLIAQFKDSCPSTQELKDLIQQKNQINGALVQIEQKIATLNKVAQSSESVVTGVKAGVTIIKQLPIPTSVPPGVGIPVSIINMFSDALDKLGTMIDKEEASLDAIPEALDLISKDVGAVISKLNEFDVALNHCLEQDSNITQEDLDAIVATTGNFVDVMTNEELLAILTTPPGLLYGDYYLTLNFIQTEEYSFDKKQIVAQNKESVPPPGEFYNENSPIEKLYGDKSFSSSNIVLVDEMKWTIDTKDLYFPPPPPAEDPLKLIYKEGQIVILMAIYGANREEAEELYELAWELSQNKGPHKSYYNTLVQKAFDESRTILEQAVANEGYEWKDGDRILDSTIKKLFLGSVTKENQIKAYISQLRNKGQLLKQTADNLGGGFNNSDKRWNEDGDFNYTPNSKLYPYSERLYLTAEHLFNDNNIGPEYVELRAEMKKRKRFMQAIFEEANYLSLINSDITFDDPLKEYFHSKGWGYNTPNINGIPIIGNASTPITYDELQTLYELEIDINVEWWMYNSDYQADPQISPNGLTYDMMNAYSKTKLFLKLRTALGNQWYNTSAQTTSELSFWYLNAGANPNSASAWYNDPNNILDPSDKWYFEFGRNGLPIPTGS